MPPVILDRLLFLCVDQGLGGLRSRTVKSSIGLGMPLWAGILQRKERVGLRIKRAIEVLQAPPSEVKH